MATEKKTADQQAQVAFEQAATGAEKRKPTDWTPLEVAQILKDARNEAKGESPFVKKFG